VIRKRDVTRIPYQIPNLGPSVGKTLGMNRTGLRSTRAFEKSWIFTYSSHLTVGLGKQSFEVMENFFLPIFR
jgi:hypothetical protein